MIISKKRINFLIDAIDSSGYIRYLIGKKYKGRFDKYKNRRTIYFLMAPAYGNIGDEAIVEATIQFLTDHFSEYKIALVNYHETFQCLSEIRRVIKRNDLIVLQGGGNIGTLYYDAERMREFIIQKFQDITIISMPQSMYFSNNHSGARRFARCKKIYNSHPNLTLISREKYSYEEMKKAFPHCKVMLNPDIVFYLSKTIGEIKSNYRSGIMSCLRSDKEDVLGDMHNQLINRLSLSFEDYTISDTCVFRNVSNDVRKNEILSLCNQFRKSQLIITDRLHGMVLSALTNTPTLVMKSLDKKVVGTYEWIHDIEYVQFCDHLDVKYIIEKSKDMLIMKVEPYDWTAFRHKYFDDLRARIGV